MKLRILGDTLRLRLSQSDIATVRDTGRVEQAVHFGPLPEQVLNYALQAEAEATTVNAQFDGRTITVRVPSATVEDWASSDRVGIDARQTIDDGRTLELLIEKDFKCLQPRPGEQDYDGFPNPKAVC